MDNTVLRYLAEAVLVIGGAVAILASRLKNENLKDLKERVEILEKERNESRGEHITNKEAIANLQGKLDAYKEIPLKFIPEALEQLIKSNNLILQTLQQSAGIVKDEAEQGGLLVHTQEPVPVQPVKPK